MCPSVQSRLAEVIDGGTVYSRSIIDDFAINIVSVLDRVFDSERAQLSPTVGFGTRSPLAIETVDPLVGMSIYGFSDVIPFLYSCYFLWSKRRLSSAKSAASVGNQQPLLRAERAGHRSLPLSSRASSYVWLSREYLANFHPICYSVPVIDVVVVLRSVWLVDLSVSRRAVICPTTYSGSLAASITRSVPSVPAVSI